MKNAFTISNPIACVNHQRSVLLIDDHQLRRNSLALWLEMANFSVALAGSASEALTLLREQEFDLILINPQPLASDGVELCWQIRNFNQRTPILFYSGETRSAETKADWRLTQKQGRGPLPACA